MNDYIYKIYDSQFNLLGTIESLETALIFIKGLYNEWQNELDLVFLIKKEIKNKRQENNNE